MFRLSSLYSFITGSSSFVKNLGGISWVERNTERYFQMPIEKVQAEAEELKKVAAEASNKKTAVSSIYQSLGKIEEAKIDANMAGIQALDSVQQKRLSYQSKKYNLLKAAARRGRVD